ncbi:hypothetical protein RvY_01263 [Ramazzottius varieornatus]|uniref:DNA-directed RNA polymerase RpoA/D/Rpb3-type domain-containing protein n=1 Tax=Ramazzottius varieornatus TaxID=947166 RepID=A0A1D1UJ98_RAMVA|nr:hypothetical protein RvY_01263 [Ramazzottius varieornatus]
MAAQTTYPPVQSGLSCILTRHQPALFTSNNAQELPSLMGFFTLTESSGVNVREISEDGMVLQFDLTGVEPCIANSIRRSLLCDVPSMAAETVLMYQNTSVFTDDHIGSRLGLIPFRADPRKFKFRLPRATVEHPESTLIFDLSIPATKTSSALRNARKDAKPPNVNVYSSHLKLIPHPAMKPDDEKRNVRPISENILIATLLPQQELLLKLHVVKGVGKDHAKFSPVSTAMFRPKPELRLLRNVYDEEARRLQSLTPKDLIALERDTAGQEKAVIRDSRLYTGSRGVLKDPTLSDCMQIAFRENEFEFTVESVGALQSAVLVCQAIEILKKRCEFLSLICPKEPNWNNIKAEETTDYKF